MHEDDEDAISGVFMPADFDGADISPEERAQTIAGRYRIVERIGEGGMGQVLKVTHRRLGKPFALKLMKASLSVDPAARTIFDREARLASALGHPNIVSIVDFGEDPDWGLFIVMEFLEGESLAERIDKHRALPVEVVCNVASQLAEALHHSHEHSVVHADLKSDNVLCVRDPNYKRRRWSVKLLDFGMAHIASAADGADDRIAGTPEYIAPERIVGNKPKPPQDLYALGIIMYEMLTGEVPFHADEPSDTLRMHLCEAPAPIHQRRGETIDVQLENIVLKLLAKDPAERHPDAATLISELRGYMRELGLRKRSGQLRAITAEADREDVAAAAFDAAPMPLAGLRADGTVIVANLAMAKLVRMSIEELEGEKVMNTALSVIHPGLRDDLRLVAMDGKVVRRRITARRAAGKQTHMRVLLTPARGAAGDCVLALHALPASK